MVSSPHPTSLVNFTRCRVPICGFVSLSAGSFSSWYLLQERNFSPIPILHHWSQARDKVLEVAWQSTKAQMHQEPIPGDRVSSMANGEQVQERKKICPGPYRFPRTRAVGSSSRIFGWAHLQVCGTSIVIPFNVQS